MALKGSDIQGIDDLRGALRKCAGGDENVVEVEYARIGEILHSNVVRLGLDEGTWQITVFANRMACEVLSAEEREYRYPWGCWAASRYDSCPPFHKKIDEKNSPNSEVRSEEKQRILMAEIFAGVLSKDPQFGAGAKSLLHYSDTHGLFPKSDWIMDV